MNQKFKGSQKSAHYSYSAMSYVVFLKASNKLKAFLHKDLALIQLARAALSNWNTGIELAFRG